LARGGKIIDRKGEVEGRECHAYSLNLPNAQYQWFSIDSLGMNA
jgi:hypothetical protein